MTGSGIIAIGNVAKHCGKYDKDTTYYWLNVVTMYNCMFQASGNNFSGVPPLVAAEDGSISLSNTDMWTCLINNVDFYNNNIKSASILEENAEATKRAIAAIEEYNTRIVALELDKLTMKTVITVQDVTEYKEGVAIGMTAALQTSDGNVSDDKDFTDSSIVMTVDGNTYSAQAAYIYHQHTFAKPCGLIIKASGASRYKGAEAAFPTVQKIIYAVLPSYMGYVDQAETLPDDPSLAGLQKVVKHSLNGTYTLTNGYDSFAYMVVAVPKDGAVNAINRIVQHGLMDAEQTIEKKEVESYTYYICSTAHGKGTYNFIIN